MMKNDEQTKEYEIHFYTFIYEEQNNKGLKKDSIKGKDNVGFAIPFCRETVSVFIHITFTTSVI